MKSLSISPGAELGAWVAALAGAYALGRQIFDTLRKRKRDREEVGDALDKAPIIRQQLELGNVGEAIRHLNDIIESQAREGQRKDNRIDELEADLDVARARAEQAEERNHDCEELAARDRRLRVAAETELAEAKKSFARTLAAMRDRQPEEGTS